MKIAVTGSSGLVGEAVVQYFREQKHDVVRVVRHNSKTQDKSAVSWNLKQRNIDTAPLEGCDVVIHLAGANIADKSWTPQYKHEIFDSRVSSTAFLSEALAGLKNKPKLLLSASASGFYGNSSVDDIKDESSPVGSGFLSDVCKEWEKATFAAEEAGIRVVHMRIGVVLAPQATIIKKMLPPFWLGLGGNIGSGKQPFSWIGLEDMAPMMLFCIEHEDISGPVNFVAPQPVSNAEFTKVFGKVLKRPTIFPLPAVVVKTLMGEMGETLLLGGVMVQPKRFLDAGYQFKHATLESSLRACLNK